MASQVVTVRTRKRFKKENFAVHCILIVASVLMILPFVWMVLASFKTFGESIRIPPQFFPQSIPGKVFSGEKGFGYLFTNYQFVLQKVDYFGLLYWNTFAMIAGRIFLAIFTSSLAAYAFAKLNFPFKNFLFSIVLVQLMMPNQIFIVPQFQMTVSLGINNSVAGLIFPGLVSAFGTFFMRQFYMGLPNELSESATLDGCNHWQIFTRVLFPLTKTPIMALSIFTAVFAWSDLMWPLIVNPDNHQATLASALSKIQLMSLVFKTPHLMAVSVLAMIPMILLYLVFQKQFVEGIAMTGLKA